MTDNIRTAFEKTGDVLTVKLSGRLDTAAAPELEKLIMPELSGVSKVVIDMKEVKYVSSASLRLLLTIQQEMEAAEGELVLTDVNPYILEVFEMTGFLDLVSVED